MNYKQTLDWLFSQLPMYQRVGASAFKKDLTNTLALCAHLDNPQQRFKTIHIGGTNGKGSCSHLLAATLQDAGYKVGLYTSPHYKDFRERIKINGEFISQKYVVNFVEAHKTLFEAIQPSFFEMTVAMAFDYFAAAKVDVAVIEVGLGGRLDSTNVILPELSVITNISYDHMNMLGDTLEKIAFEKAGIIKHTIPVVIGESQAESKPVFIAKANEENSPIYFADQNYEVFFRDDDTALIRTQQHKKSLITVPLNGGLGKGSFQQKNLATIAQTIEILQSLGWAITLEHLASAMTDLYGKVKFMGRWQKLQDKPLTIADSGHNEAGVRSAVAQLNTLKYNQLHIITGFVNDKDIDKILALYPLNATYYFAKANIPRGLDAKLLREKAAVLGMRGKAYSSVKNAYKAALRQAQQDDLVLILGSIFVVAEVI
jgi:dihydrofolate synthase / folylpolyglutamate synthase